MQSTEATDCPDEPESEFLTVGDADLVEMLVVDAQVCRKYTGGLRWLIESPVQLRR